MKYYLVGYDKNKIPVVLFFDISDFEEQFFKGNSVLTFTEGDIDYTYMGDNGKSYTEISKKAPEFDTYEVISEIEAKKRGFNTNPKASSVNSKSTNLGRGIKLKSGKVVDILDPDCMSKLTPAEATELSNLLQQLLPDVGIILPTQNQPQSNSGYSRSCGLPPSCGYSSYSSCGSGGC